MPRSISTGFRNDIEASSSSELILTFVVIEHPQLAEPIRVVDDVVDYIYGGERYIGVPFQFSIVTDDERPPRGQVSIQNADQIIGNAVLALQDKPRLTVKLLAGSDFSAAVDSTLSAKTEIGTATVEYQASHLYLSNVQGDVLQVEADLTSFDPTSEPYPAIRSTRDRLPGLYR